MESSDDLRTPAQQMSLGGLESDIIRPKKPPSRSGLDAVISRVAFSFLSPEERSTIESVSKLTQQQVKKFNEVEALKFKNFINDFAKEMTLLDTTGKYKAHIESFQQLANHTYLDFNDISWRVRSLLRTIVSGLPDNEIEAQPTIKALFKAISSISDYSIKTQCIEEIFQPFFFGRYSAPEKIDVAIMLLNEIEDPLIKSKMLGQAIRFYHGILIKRQNDMNNWDKIIGFINLIPDSEGRSNAFAFLVSQVEETNVHLDDEIINKYLPIIEKIEVEKTKSEVIEKIVKYLLKQNSPHNWEKGLNLAKTIPDKVIRSRTLNEVCRNYIFKPFEPDYDEDGIEMDAPKKDNRFRENINDSTVAKILEVVDLIEDNEEKSDALQQLCTYYIEQNNHQKVGELINKIPSQLFRDRVYHDIVKNEVSKDENVNFAPHVLGLIENIQDTGVKSTALSIVADRLNYTPRFNKISRALVAIRNVIPTKYAKETFSNLAFASFQKLGYHPSLIDQSIVVANSIPDEEVRSQTFKEIFRYFFVKDRLDAIINLIPSISHKKNQAEIIKTVFWYLTCKRTSNPDARTNDQLDKILKHFNFDRSELEALGQAKSYDDMLESMADYFLLFPGYKSHPKVVAIERGVAEAQTFINNKKIQDLVVQKIRQSESRTSIHHMTLVTHHFLLRLEEPYLRY